jgi:predicted transposase YbfD/YdcC
MVLKGRVVVGDAMFCQRELCQQILDAGGHYFLAVKGNQATLEREISLELSVPDGAFSPLHSAPATLGA